jgi:hypothetical protein
MSNSNSTGNLAALAAVGANSHLVPSTSGNHLVLGTTVEVLQEDINMLALDKGRLQTEKWNLEEKLKFLEEDMSKLKQQLEEKELLVKEYLQLKIMGKETADLVAKMNKPAQKGASGSFFGWGATAANPTLTEEVQQRMEAILQDTMIRNIQLQVSI